MLKVEVNPTGFSYLKKDDYFEQNQEEIAILKGSSFSEQCNLLTISNILEKIPDITEMISLQNVIVKSSNYENVEEEVKTLLGIVLYLYKSEEYLSNYDHLLHCYIDLMGTHIWFKQQITLSIWYSSYIELIEMIKRKQLKAGVLKLAFFHLYELLLWVLQEKLSDTKLWNELVHCFVIALQNLSPKQRYKIVQDIDLALFRNLIDKAAFLSLNYYNILIKYFYESLYRHQVELKRYPAEFDYKRFCNISEICDSAESATFLVSKWLSFSDPLDHNTITRLTKILFSAACYGKLNAEEIDLLYKQVKEAKFPEFLQRVSLYLPDSLVEIAVKECFPTGLPNNKLISKNIIIALYEVEKLLCNANKVDNCFQGLLDMTVEGKLAGGTENVINSLLHSEINEDRENGQKWVLQLFRKSKLCMSKKNNILKDLLSSNNPEVRRLYYYIVRNLCSTHSRYETLFYDDDMGGDWNIAMWINSKLYEALVDSVEIDLQNIMTVAQTLFILVTDGNQEKIILRMKKGIAEQITEGKLGIRVSVLNCINIMIFKSVYKLLSSYEFNDSNFDIIRILRAITFLIVTKCQTDAQDYQKIGGANFFNSLHNSQDPFVCLLGSYLTVNKLKLEKPDLCAALLKRRIWSKQEKNPYQLILSIQKFAV